MRPRKTNGRLMDGVFALNEFVTNSGTPVMRPVFRRYFFRQDLPSGQRLAAHIGGAFPPDPRRE